MSGDVPVALAQWAGQTVAAAAVTDVWEAVRGRFPRLLGRGDSRKAEAAERWLAQTRQQLATAAPGADLEQVREAQAERWAGRFADLLDEDPGVEAELRVLVEEIAAQLPTGTVFAVDHSVAAGRDMTITAPGGGIAAGVIHGDVAATIGTFTAYFAQGPQQPVAQDERLWSRQAETYAAMLQYQGGGMIENPTTASAQEWAVRDWLIARATVFASSEVLGLWQKSALAHHALAEYVSEEWPQWPYEDVEDQMEEDPESEAPSGHDRGPWATGRADAG